MRQVEIVQSRFLYDLASHLIVRLTDLETQDPTDTILVGVVKDRPFIQSLGKGKKMAGFTLNGTEMPLGVGGRRSFPIQPSNTDHEVRIFGRSWARIVDAQVREGSRMSLSGSIREFAERNPQGDFVTGRFFIVATNTYPDIH